MHSRVALVLVTLFVAGAVTACSGDTVSGSGSTARGGSTGGRFEPPSLAAPTISPATPSQTTATLSGPQLQANPPLPPGGEPTSAQSPSSGTSYYRIPASFDSVRAFYARAIPALGLKLGTPAISRGLRNVLLSYHYTVSSPVDVVNGVHGILTIDRYFNRAFLPADETVVEFSLS